MTVDTIKGIVLVAVVVLLQVLVFNNIHLFGCATPLFLIYVLLLAPANALRWTVLLVGFALGFVSDIFSNTPGVASASMTLIALVQPMYLKLFLTRESPEGLQPSFASLGFYKYISYSLPLVLLFVVVFFTLEEFSFFHLGQWLLFILGSFVLTYLLILLAETLRKG